MFGVLLGRIQRSIPFTDASDKNIYCREVPVLEIAHRCEHIPDARRIDGLVGRGGMRSC